MVEALMSFASVGASLFGNQSAQAQAKDQQKLQEKQANLAEEDYYRQIQQQQEWNEKYGAIEHNMLKYVQNLDSTKIASKNNDLVKRSFETARQNMDSHLAQRGFETAGGVSAEMFTQLADQEAQTYIAVQQKAEQDVLNTQQSVLNGNKQPQPSTAGMQNVIGNQMTTNQNNYKMITDANKDVFGSVASLGKRLSTTNTGQQTNIAHEQTVVANNLRRV